MPERNIGLEILDGIREIKDFKVGKVNLRTRKLSTPSHPKMIHTKLKLSQAALACLMGVSLRTVHQDWEQDRREPSEPAKSLLRIAEQHPRIF